MVVPSAWVGWVSRERNGAIDALQGVFRPVISPRVHVCVRLRHRRRHDGWDRERNIHCTGVRVDSLTLKRGKDE